MKKKFVKKISVILTTLTLVLSSFFLSACGENDLTTKVSELKSDLYYGFSELNSIFASYGFCENPKKYDGLVGEKVYYLNFKLNPLLSKQEEYYLKFTFNGVEKEGKFVLNPVTNALTLKFEIEDFNIKEFNVTLLFGGKTEEIKMNSLIKEEVISPERVLEIVKEKQSVLLNAYSENGELKAEIIMRVLVRSEMPFWYVGITNSEDNLKAFLIDGKSGEILAVREIL